MPTNKHHSMIEKNCPFCGALGTMDHTETKNGVVVHFVKCKGSYCQAEGPKNSDPNAAIDAWNDRE